jgi:hypothetical protein
MKFHLQNRSDVHASAHRLAQMNAPVCPLVYLTNLNIAVSVAHFWLRPPSGPSVVLAKAQMFSAVLPTADTPRAETGLRAERLAREAERECRRCATLFRLGFKRRDLAVFLPKLYVVTIHETLGVLFRDLIVWAHKLYCPEKATVDSNNVRAIPSQMRPPPPKLTRNTKSHFRLIGPGHKFKVGH